MLLFLKHTFQLPELSSPEIASMRRCSINSPRNEHSSKMPSPRKEDSAKHAHAQLVTGLEEIVMFCFQQSVYTITKVSALDPYFLKKENMSKGYVCECTRKVQRLSTFHKFTKFTKSFSNLHADIIKHIS